MSIDVYLLYICITTLSIQINSSFPLLQEYISFTIIILQRRDAEKLLRYISEHVEIEGDIIKPKPIDVTLVKFGKLKYVTKLDSKVVLVKTRMNRHDLSLRCLYKYRNHSSATWLEETYHRLSSDLDEIKSSISEAIVGEIKLYSSSAPSLPCPWVFCYGQALSRIEYQRLFSVIGESFGAGDGKTTFNVPDFRDRFPLGLNPIRSPGDSWEKGGNKEQILTIDQMPIHHHSAGTLNTTNTGTHAHTVNDPGHNHAGYTHHGDAFVSHLSGIGHAVPGYIYAIYNGGHHKTHKHVIPVGKTGITLDNDGTHSHSIEGSTGSTGHGNSFSIIPPYQTIAYIIFTGANCA
jgi:microcystin-dependent protein